MSQLIGVYGAAGCGRGIMPLVREQYPAAVVVFIDDGLAPGFVNGHTILSWTDFIGSNYSEKAVTIAIAESHTREKIAQKCSNAGASLIEVRAKSVIQMDDVYIGKGACLSPFVTLTSNIEIGNCFHANLYSYVEHDCVIGNFVTLAPGVKVNGNIKIGDHAYIGSGAVIRQGIRVGSGAIIGMGAVVTRDVPCNAIVVGNPARPMIKD